MFHHRDKFFIFIPKKKFASSFVLSFGHRVHFRQKTEDPPFSKIQKKLNTLFISFKVAHSAQEAPKKISGRLLIRKVKTIEVGFRGRQCFTMEKSFLFLYQKKKFA
jgi:hypothetical protein